jgi:predicted Rossmann fold flavoprotein
MPDATNRSRPEPDAQMTRRVAVIGAGAAGAMAAIFAAAAGAQVILLERTRDGGRKILISGGGRCNVLPARVDESRFVTDSSINTLRKIVRSWPLAEQVAFFEGDLGIPLVEEVESVKLFPASHRARDVRDGLLAHAARLGAVMQAESLVTDVVPSEGGWRVHRAGVEPLGVAAVIIATGGLSVPNTGSDGTGFRVLERLGHVMHPTYAALTPLIAEPPVFGALSGVSLPVTLTARAGSRGTTAEGGFLFTHHGYSGPSVLDVSHVAVRSRGSAQPAQLSVRWTGLDDDAVEALLRPQGTRTVLGALRTTIPDRLAALLLDRAAVNPARSLAELSREERRRVLDALLRDTLPWSGDEGYRKAEVTGGGVSLAEIDPRSMQSRRHPGLYLCGEVLDAFGPIGGYNFLWAWATGRAAGRGAAGG